MCEYEEICLIHCKDKNFNKVGMSLNKPISVKADWELNKSVINVWINTFGTQHNNITIKIWMWKGILTSEWSLYHTFGM